MKKLQEKKKEEEMMDEQEEKAKEEDDDWETDSEDYYNENPEMVQLGELLQGMNLNEKDEDDLNREVEDLLCDMERVKVKN